MGHAPTKRSLARFQYFSQCQDSIRLPSIDGNENGLTAEECFHAHETYGLSLPCREPELLGRALNGKERHGITVTDCATDYVDRLIFSSELAANYPEWVCREIISRAQKIALDKLGFVPRFVSSGKDFSAL